MQSSERFLHCWMWRDLRMWQTWNRDILIPITDTDMAGMPAQKRIVTKPWKGRGICRYQVQIQVGSKVAFLNDLLSLQMSHISQFPSKFIASDLVLFLRLSHQRTCFSCFVSSTSPRGRAKYAVEDSYLADCSALSHQNGSTNGKAYFNPKRNRYPNKAAREREGSTSSIAAEEIKTAGLLALRIMMGVDGG